MTPSKTINVRVTKREKAMLREMAQREGKNLSAFLRDVAVAKARHVLANWRYDQPAHNKFRSCYFTNSNCPVCHYWPCKCPRTGA